MSAVYGFNGGFPSVLLHHLCFLGEWGNGGVRKAPATEGCRTVKKMSTWQQGLHVSLVSHV